MTVKVENKNIYVIYDNGKDYNSNNFNDYFNMHNL